MPGDGRHLPRVHLPAHLGASKEVSGGSSRVLPRPLRIALVTLFVLFVSVSVIASLTEVWLFNTWESLAADEVVYHLKVSLEGTNSDMIVDYLTTYGLVELGILGAVFALLYAVRTRPRVLACLVCLVTLSCAGALGFALRDLDARMGLLSYLADSPSSPDRAPDGQPDFVEAHYVDPSATELTFPETRRNLVYLFLESMELTYADTACGGAFERGCIPELVDVAREGEDFSGDDATLQGALALPGSTWTAGAMFAQTSGLPLKVPVSGNFMQGADDFFPQITTMGDILAQEGYHQVLLIGSEAEFGGRDALFSTHGSFELHDYGHAVETGRIPADYHVWWGYEDERLFDFAREELLDLAAEGGPFNLTMLTADTHFEDGYLCNLCGDEFGDNRYANVMACSSRQVAAFVAWMREQDFWDDTTVVICGDHPTMDSNFCENVPADYERRTFTVILNAAAAPADPARRRSYSTMDLFPTTLAALGAHIEGDRLGLGTDLFSGHDTLIEELGIDGARDGLSGQSAFLSTYLGPDILMSALTLLDASARLRVEPASGDTVIVSLEGIGRLGREYLLGARLEVRDRVTGLMRSYAMSIVEADEDDGADAFTCVARLPLTEGELARYELAAYLWGRGVSHHRVATYVVVDPHSAEAAPSAEVSTSTESSTDVPGVPETFETVPFEVAASGGAWDDWGVPVAVVAPSEPETPAAPPADEIESPPTETPPADPGGDPTDEPGDEPGGEEPPSTGGGEETPSDGGSTKDADGT